MVVTTRRATNPNSTNVRAAMPLEGDGGELYRVDRLKTSWGLWHELGHHRQHTSHWSWPAQGEDTVNIYSLAARRLFPDRTAEHGTPAEWRKAQQHLAAADAFDTANHFVRLAMFEQLRVLFGDTFYHHLHQHARNSAPIPESDRKRWFAVTACRITGQDLTGYFTAWGLQPDQRTRDEIAALKLPAPTADLTTTAVYQTP
ncbi:hypothetical protein SUDANB180_00045 [Streptomyces sp. enrichment culture]